MDYVPNGRSHFLHQKWPYHFLHFLEFVLKNSILVEISVFLRKKSGVEISVILIIDLPKYHFLHQTEDNPSSDYFIVLVSDILWLKFFQKLRIRI